MRWVHRREARRLFALRARHRGAAPTSACSSARRRRACSARRPAVAPTSARSRNGIDLAFFDADRPISLPRAPSERGQGPIVLFTGQMDYRAQCRRRAAGSPPTCCRGPAGADPLRHRRPQPDRRGARARRRATCTVTGAVADMRRWLAAADVVSAPLRIARGIQNKVLEAMAMAKPVVATAGRLRGHRSRARPRPDRRRRRRGAWPTRSGACSPIAAPAPRRWAGGTTARRAVLQLGPARSRRSPRWLGARRA